MASAPRTRARQTQRRALGALIIWKATGGALQGALVARQGGLWPPELLDQLQAGIVIGDVRPRSVATEGREGVFQPRARDIALIVGASVLVPPALALEQLYWPF